MRVMFLWFGDEQANWARRAVEVRVMMRFILIPWVIGIPVL